MDGDSRLYIILVAILLFLAAVFAITETALSSVSKNRIKVLSERGDARAKNAWYALEHFELAISTLLICTNIVHLSAAALVTVFVTAKWGVGAVSISTIITTIVVFFVGEMLPKSIAKRNSEKFVLQTAGLLLLLMKVFNPISFVLGKIGTFAAKYTKAEEEVSVTEDEIYDIIEDLQEEGSINENQGDLIQSALSFSDVTVEAILTPRVDVSAINVNDDPEVVFKSITEMTHSRIPVYEGTIDNIIGVLQSRRYMKAYLSHRQYPELRPLIDDVYFTAASTKIDELLEEMSKKKLNMAVIADNYGGTMGIVTVEDILEEIVGEIWDEDDVVEEPVEKISDGIFMVDAGETVEDLLEYVDYEDPEENEDFVNMLVSEWALENFQSIPEVGDSFDYHRLHLSVYEMDHNRIVTLKVELLPEEVLEETAEEHEEGKE